MKRIFSITVIIITFLLTGCSPIESRLDKRLIIQGIGIDYDDGNYKTTVMYMDTENPVGEADVTSAYVEGQGMSVLSALTDTTNKVGREPLYGQCGFIILGENLAKEGISEALDFFTDYYEIHPNVNIFCAECPASEVMNAENMNDRLMQNFSDTEVTTGKTISSPLKEVCSDLKGKKANAIMALVGVDDKNAVLKGAAAFSSDKLGSFLNSEQCMAVLLMRGEAKSIWDIFPSNDNKNFNYSLSNCKSDVKINTDGEINFDIFINSKARVYAKPSDSKTESKIEARINNICQNAITDLLKKKQLDVFKLERILYNQDYKKYSSIKDPKSSVVSAGVNIHTNIELQR